MMTARNQSVYFHTAEASSALNSSEAMTVYSTGYFGFFITGKKNTECDNEWLRLFFNKNQ